MQRPRDSPREMPVVEYIGFQFEHEQQDNPGDRIDTRGEPFNDISQVDAIGEAMRRSSPFFGEEQVNVDGEKCVDRVFE